VATLPEVQGAWFFFYGKGDVITERELIADYNAIIKYKTIKPSLTERRYEI